MKKIVIGDREIRPGTRVKIELPVVKLYTDSHVSMPVYVIRSKKEGPTVFVSAAVHGDEINGVEIVRRIIKSKSFRLSKGTLILVPIVNPYGLLNQSRYMPDRRDLNRTFPGSAKGSLAGRVADRFLEEIVEHCDYGIDLHTGAIHRSNLPQIRANLNDPETKELASAIGVPVLLNANIRDGSLRQAAVESNTKVLLYEAGEALRFDEFSIRAGVKGIANVLAFIGMLKPRKTRKHSDVSPFISNHSSWMRAGSSGIVSSRRKLGDRVAVGDVLAEIGSPFGDVLSVVKATKSGIVIGEQNIPLVHEGDAMYHIAYFSEDDELIAEDIERLQDTLLPEENRGEN